MVEANNVVKLDLIQTTKEVANLILNSKINVLSKELYRADIEGIKIWLSNLKNDKVTLSIARIFNELLASINQALEVVDPNIIIYISSITNFINSGTINSYTQLNTESATVSSIIHRAIVQLISHGLEFSYMKRQALRQDFIKKLLPVLIDYVRDV